MPNDEHRDRLDNGVDDWNSWRQAEDSVLVDLAGVELKTRRLSRYNLSAADLTEAVLDGSTMYGTNLRQARMEKARLYAVHACGADLQGATLRGAFLRGVDLRDANLCGCDLRDADLCDANLEGANLRGARLYGAAVRGANLSQADLRNLDVDPATLRGATTDGARMTSDLPFIDDEDDIEEDNPFVPIRRAKKRFDSIASRPATPVLDAALTRLRRSLVDSGELSEEELAQAVAWNKRYTQYQLTHPKCGWPVVTLVAFIELIKPHLMFRAWAAYHNRPFTSISQLCTEVAPVFGDGFFEGLPVGDVQQGLSFGQTLRAMNAVSAEDLERVRSMRAQIASQVHVRMFLGTLLVRESLISLGVYYQALALYCGVEFTGVDDETVARIAEAGEFTDLHTVTIDAGRPPFDDD